MNTILTHTFFLVFFCCSVLNIKQVIKKIRDWYFQGACSFFVPQKYSALVVTWPLTPSQPERSHEDKTLHHLTSTNPIHCHWCSQLTLCWRTLELSQPGWENEKSRIPGNVWSLQTIFWPALGLKERTIDSAEFSAEKTFISASVDLLFVLPVFAASAECGCWPDS